jgi:hypothetical protein
MLPQMIHRVRENSPWAARSLRGLGIPDSDVVAIDSPQGKVFYQLAPAPRERQSSPAWESNDPQVAGDGR